MTREEIRSVGNEVAVGSSEIKELKAPVLTVLAVESCEIREESSLPRAPVAVEASETRLERAPLGTPAGTLADAVTPAETGGRIEEAADERTAN